MLEFSQSFRCPNCNEYINTEDVECRFCHQPVDAQAAIHAASLQENINRACNDASTVRNLGGAAFVLTCIWFLPVVGCFAGAAAIVLFIASVAVLIRWEVKYAWIRTVDPDFAVAKRNRLIGMLLAIASVVLVVIVFVGSIIYELIKGPGYGRY